jgi:hypothetical protein
VFGAEVRTEELDILVCLLAHNEEGNSVVGVDFVGYADNARDDVFKDEDDIVTSV